MKPVYFVGLLLLCLLSCRQNRQRSSNGKDTSLITKKQDTNFVKANKDTSAIPDTTRILLSYKAAHLFSDTLKKDDFNITLYGKNVIEGIIIFKISNYKNQQIFKDTFPASDLLGDEADMLTNKQQKNTITARMAKFLNERNFTSPAIDSTEKFEDAFENPIESNKSDWDAIKTDHTSIGFIYSHGYESTYGISYSKSKRKVINIFYSD